MKQWILLLAALVLLNACSLAPVAEPGPGNQGAYDLRAENIAGISAWSLVGKISLDDGEDGGSGRFRWDVRGDSSTMDFHGAMGRGAWHMETGPAGAVLRLADGDEHFALGVDTLVHQQIGWSIPVGALQWWVRGLAAPGSVDEQQLDDKGLLTSLGQFGWQIDFNRYGSDSGMAMPTRLDARKKNYRVKLAVSRWRIPTDDVISN